MIKTPSFTSSASDGPSEERKAENDGLKCKNEENGCMGNICIIDVVNVDEKNEEKVCRICQVSSESEENNGKLVSLGCACKGDLGISHYHCAFAWFMQKGNRTCEICGNPAKNIEGIEDTGFRVFAADISIITSTEIAMRQTENQSRLRCTRTVWNFLLMVFLMSVFLSWVFRPFNYHDEN